MDNTNLDLIRFIIDSAIGVGCLVLMVRLWYRRTMPSVKTVTDGARSPDSVPPDSVPIDDSDLRFTMATPSSPHRSPNVGAMKTEVLRLTQSGIATTEIARKTGLSKGEVELIQKFAEKF